MELDDTMQDIPYSFWAKVKSSLCGIKTSLRVDTADRTMSKLDFEVVASGGPIDTDVRMYGWADFRKARGAISTIAAKQRFNIPAGRLTVEPRFSVKAQRGAVRISYDVDQLETTVMVDADQDSQKLAVSKQIGERNRLSPFVSTRGAFGLEYSREIGSGTLTAAVRPNDSASLVWREGNIAATLETPMKGFYPTQSSKLSVRCSGI